MIIDEKKLKQAMARAYKGDGYTVASFERGGMETIHICADNWTVEVISTSIPRCVLGLIVEHVGVIPEPGTAWRCQKKDTQAEIFEESNGDRLRDLTVREQIRRTELTMCGLRLWQTVKTLQVVELSEEQEDILDWRRQPVWLVAGRWVFLDDDESRAWIYCSPAGEQNEGGALDYLGKRRWVAE